MKNENESVLKYGTELSIVGFVLGNGKESELVWFPDSTVTNPTQIQTTDELMDDILYQLDTLGVRGLEKTILRKSQRNIEQNTSWDVFRRDGFKCRYCGTDKVAMTVDHIVRWENQGASTKDNLICSCKKCNNTRGAMEYQDWLNDPYYLKVSAKLDPATIQLNIDAWEKAKNVPLRSTQRSR